MTPALPPKKDVARALLLRGNVFVHLDPRKDGVQVPEWLSNQPQLVLQIGLDMPLPIPDLRVDDEGVSGTLSFQRSPFRCEVRWSAVFALVGDDGRGMVWPDALPAEIASEVAREVERGGHRRPARAAQPTADLMAFPPTGKRPEKTTVAVSGRPSAPKKTRPLPPYLRVVK